MAWVTQDFEHGCFHVLLRDDEVLLYEDGGEDVDGDQERYPITSIRLFPFSSDDAHNWAMMLRKAARRLEEIGKGLS